MSVFIEEPIGVDMSKEKLRIFEDDFRWHVNLEETKECIDSESNKTCAGTSQIEKYLPQHGVFLLPLGHGDLLLPLGLSPQRLCSEA
ncbi:hypothetical protein Nepgr_013415 [Nepenthes gracilis]|uniref:Uncharacterized protein n=1 Tax=Nepenthes gracilis TaxID=150966 RepID=A0AAD3SIV4_NEPGR|nr:hypothetical protein Nepgr_013415 [Nepenthes gracilis]